MCGRLWLLRSHEGPWKYQIRLELDTGYLIYLFRLQWFSVLDGCRSTWYCWCRSIVEEACRSISGDECRSIEFFPKQLLLESDLYHRAFACWAVPRLWNYLVVYLLLVCRLLFLLQSSLVVFIYPTTNRVVSISHTVEISVDRFVVSSVGRCSLSSSLLRLSVDRWQACHVERWCIPIPRGMM